MHGELLKFAYSINFFNKRWSTSCHRGVVDLSRALHRHDDPVLLRCSICNSVHNLQLGLQGKTVSE